MGTHGQLYIGVPVQNEAEAIAIYEQLDIDIGEDGVFCGDGRFFTVSLKGRKYKAYVSAMTDEDVMESFAVGFHLTDRYMGAILDADSKWPDGRSRGRPEVFVFDPLDIVEILVEVRQWWPQAQVFIWDVAY